MRAPLRVRDCLQVDREEALVVVVEARVDDPLTRHAATRAHLRDLATFRCGHNGGHDRLPGLDEWGFADLEVAAVRRTDAPVHEPTGLGREACADSMEQRAVAPRVSLERRHEAHVEIPAHEHRGVCGGGGGWGGGGVERVQGRGACAVSRRRVPLAGSAARCSPSGVDCVHKVPEADVDLGVRDVEGLGQVLVRRPR